MKIISFFTFFTVLLAVLFLVKIDGETAFWRKITKIRNRIQYTLFLESSKSAVTMLVSRKDGQIAHAGGAINGDVYTDSKEALDKSYLKGFRLLELDLQMTCDGKLAAVHDWQSWKKESRFSGPIPPSHAEFMQTKIMGKYTPLDSLAIIEWFQNHPDAFLVTDKIKDPQIIVNHFPFYKERIYMEIFSWEEFKRAKEMEIYAPMLNGDLIVYDPDGLEKARENGVVFISLSRKRVAKSLDIMQELSVSGSKIYLYHVNYDGYDEEKVLCKVADYIFGFYSDTLVAKDFQCL